MTRHVIFMIRIQSRIDIIPTQQRIDIELANKKKKSPQSVASYRLFNEKCVKWCDIAYSALRVCIRLCMLQRDL